MPPFGNRALKTGVERIAGKEGDELWMGRVFRIKAVRIGYCLEARNAADRLCRTSFNMVDVIES